MNQHNQVEQLQLLIRQQVEQIATIAAKVEEVREKEKMAQRPKIMYQVKIAKLPLFNGEVGQVAGF